MPRNPPMNLVFPAAGVVRRLGLRDSTGGRGPFPSPWCYNVRLEDNLTNRLRGGRFTGPAASADPGAINYRGRLLTMSDNAILASRQGDTTDFNYGDEAEDTGRATIFQLSDSSDLVGSTVVALVPHKDSFLLCFTATETWVLSGDPVTGQLRKVSSEVGIISARAWAKREDAVYFLSARGLYMVGADGSGLKPLSEDVIPEHLIGLSDTSCVLDYDHATRGLSIHLTTAPSWFFDTERGGFWPFSTATTQSHVLLGPFHLGNENSYGRILNLQGNMAAGSADVTWRIVTGDTAEAAAANGKSAIEAAVAGTSYASYVSTSGTFSAGRSHMAYPRTRAIWCCIWLSASSDWAYETLAMTRAPSGMWR